MDAVTNTLKSFYSLLDCGGVIRHLANTLLRLVVSSPEEHVGLVFSAVFNNSLMCRKQQGRLFMACNYEHYHLLLSGLQHAVPSTTTAAILFAGDLEGVDG